MFNFKKEKKKSVCRETSASFSSIFFQFQQHSGYHPSFSVHKTALMTKTTLIFPAFSVRFVDLAVQFCFRCKFSFHEKPFKSSWRWRYFPGQITYLLLRIAINEIASYSFWQQITSNGSFRVRRSGQRSAFEFPLLYRRTATWNLFIKWSTREVWRARKKRKSCPRLTTDTFLLITYWRVKFRKKKNFFGNFRLIRSLLFSVKDNCGQNRSLRTDVHQLFLRILTAHEIHMPRYASSARAK